MPRTINKPLISIIIPTYNSSKTLEYSLKSISRQTYKNIEIIIVDKYSIDDTVSIARRFGARVYYSKGERSIQKNLGALVANGDYLYFVDSDFVLHPRVVEEAVNLTLSGCEAIVIRNISYPKQGLVARARFFERLFYHGGSPYEAARFIRKDIFIKVGGFDPKLYANEDIDLHRRLLANNVKICRTSKTFEIHLGEPKSIKEFIIKNIYYGKNYMIFLRKNPDIKYATPVRYTFLKKDFIAFTGRRWTLGLFLIPLLKILQFTAGGVGAFFRLRIKPYKAEKTIHANTRYK